MLYRALFGIIPMLLVALFATGAIPLSSVLPTSTYVSRGSDRDSDGKGEKDQPYRARTPEGIISQRIGLLPADSIEMMEDNMRATKEIHREIERAEEDHRRGLDRTKWEPRRAGWGREKASPEGN